MGTDRETRPNTMGLAWLVQSSVFTLKAKGTLKDF